jgi:hypothetical protein
MRERKKRRRRRRGKNNYMSQMRQKVREKESRTSLMFLAWVTSRLGVNDGKQPGLLL